MASRSPTALKHTPRHRDSAREIFRGSLGGGAVGIGRPLVQPEYFTANPATGGTKTAKGHHIPENPGDSTVRNIPDPLSKIHFRGPKIPGVCLRTNGEAVGTGVLCGSNAMSGFSPSLRFRLANSPVRPNPRPAGLYLNTIMMEPACRPFSVGRNGLNGPQHFSSPEARARCLRNEGRDGPAYAVYDDSRICPGEFANGPVNSGFK